MDRLCDEVVQLIFFELSDPTPLALLSKRFYHFSQDPYVRAHYFISRYGHSQALYYALGRGGVINERVSDLLLACGAHMSRYIVQVAMHHFFRTTSHFVKTGWVRTMSFPTFAHFMKLAAETYGDIPCGKAEDDGSMFANFLKESRYPVGMKSVTWESIWEILEKFKFIPFSNKDPIMAQFPLALAIEPRLLPLAEANGFHMDSKYRDFVFRKMFEKPAISSESRVDEIVHNVRELIRLDSKMFLSRTVAAEICMEAKSNEHAYGALKKLDKTGELLFELSTLVEDLIKLFSKSRTVTMPNTIAVLRQLYADFPSPDPTVRLVLLLTVFLSENCVSTAATVLQSKLEPLGLTPLSRKDIYNVLINPYIERYSAIMAYAEAEVALGPHGVDELIEDVAIKCLEVGCKGRMLRKLVDEHDSLRGTIVDVVLKRYKIDLDDLPAAEDEKACFMFEAPLCRDTSFFRFTGNLTGAESSQVGLQGYGSDGDGDGEEDDPVLERTGEEPESRAQEDGAQELGLIGHDTLTTMIRQDELARCRPRRRQFYGSIYGTDMQEPLQVGKWVKSIFDTKSAAMAVFMTHAVINDNTLILRQYLKDSDKPNSPRAHVPVTLKHFRLLARLGKAPDWLLISEIMNGADFYVSEEDYIRNPAETKRSSKVKVKTEPTQSNLPLASSSTKNRKRPRRSAAETVRSYAIPDSDDEPSVNEEIVNIGLWPFGGSSHSKKKVESNLQQWIKHLSVLLKEEQTKFKEKKKRLEKESPDQKIRVPKSEFLKSLTVNLRNLRKSDSERRLELYGPEAVEFDFSDGDDEEYQQRNSRSKRRKTMRNS